MSYKIDLDGTIIRDKEIVEKGSSIRSRFPILFLLLLAAIGIAIGFGVKKNELEKTNRYLQRDLSNVKDNYAELERAKNAIKTILKDMSQSIHRLSLKILMWEMRM